MGVPVDTPARPLCRSAAAAVRSCAAATWAARCRVACSSPDSQIRVPRAEQPHVSPRSLHLRTFSPHHSVRIRFSPDTGSSMQCRHTGKSSEDVRGRSRPAPAAQRLNGNAEGKGRCSPWLQRRGGNGESTATPESAVSVCSSSCRPPRGAQIPSCGGSGCFRSTCTPDWKF